tara:strand:+ start:2560 stop:2973 length:414 start_codon:yes stop_codon:yes gene_type:complete
MNNLNKIYQLVSSKNFAQKELGYMLLITNLDTFKGPFSKEDKYTFVMIHKLLSPINKLCLMKHALIHKLNVDLLCSNEDEIDKITKAVLLPVITKWETHPIVAIKQYTELNFHQSKDLLAQIYPNWGEEWKKNKPNK